MDAFFKAFVKIGVVFASCAAAVLAVIAAVLILAPEALGKALRLILILGCLAGVVSLLVMLARAVFRGK